MGKVYLAVFRCLSFTAIKSTDRNKGKIANHENSGTVGVGVGVRVGLVNGSVLSTKNMIGVED